MNLDFVQDLLKLLRVRMLKIFFVCLGHGSVNRGVQRCHEKRLQSSYSHTTQDNSLDTWWEGCSSYGPDRVWQNGLLSSPSLWEIKVPHCQKWSQGPNPLPNPRTCPADTEICQGVGQIHRLDDFDRLGSLLVPNIFVTLSNWIGTYVRCW